MTPLATKFAHQLALPKAKRTVDDRANALGLIGGDLHCFEVTAIAKAVQNAMNEENIWPEVETMAPATFLPSPVTWLEMNVPERRTRVAWVLEQSSEHFRLVMVGEGPGAPYALPICLFRARGVLELGERIEQIDLAEEALGRPENDSEPLASAIIGSGPDNLKAKVGLLKLELNRMEKERNFLSGVIEVERFVRHGIAFCVLLLDLINTPGLIGLRQHDPHRGLARRLAAARSGSYPLRGWSEVVLKHQTRIAEDGERETGATYHKCLHFVRSHRRHYRNGHVTIIPAHWRGDPALGIKRTRYRVAA